MSETTIVPTPNEVPLPPSEGLSTQANEWELLAAQHPNKDAHVPITDPLFDGCTVQAIVRKPEVVAADADGGGQAVKLAFELKEEMISVEGVKKVPGTTWSPRFSSIILAPKVADGDDKKKADAQRMANDEKVVRGLRDLHRLAVAAGVLPRSNENLGDILRAMGQVEGKVVKLKFKVIEGKKRDEQGRKMKMQNYSIASLDEKENVNGAPKAGENY